MGTAFTVVISLIISRDRLSQGKIYQPSQHPAQIFTNSCWNSCLSIISNDICSVPCNGRRGSRRFSVSFLSLHTLHIWLLGSLMLIKRKQERYREHIDYIGNGRWLLEEKIEQDESGPKTVWVVLGWRLGKLHSKRRENIEGNDLAYRKLRAGKRSLNHVSRSRTCNPLWQVLETLGFSLILSAKAICRDSPQAGFVWSPFMKGFGLFQHGPNPFPSPILCSLFWTELYPPKIHMYLRRWPYLKTGSLKS